MRTGKTFKKTILVMLVLALLLPNTGLFAAQSGPDPATPALTADDFIVNDSTYNPITSDLRALNWDVHSRTWFDAASSKAFTQERSTALGDGSEDHVQIGTDTITFFGTAYQPLLDYIYYADTEPGNKMYKFSIEPKNIDWHTLYSFGFLINCVTADGKVSGYFLALEQTNISIRLINNADIAALAALGTSTGTSSTGGGITFNGYKQIASIPYPEGTSGTAKKDFVLESTYTGFKVKLGGQYIYEFDLDTVSAANPANVPTGYTGGSDFGMYAAYKSHSCSVLSYAVMSEIGLYTEVSANKSSIKVSIADFTKEGDPRSSVQGMTFVQEGYIGQGYTITPPQKIGKYAYIGNDDVITGVYGDQAKDLTLNYASPTVIIEAVDQNGKVFKQEFIDGLDLNTTYTYLPKAISGYTRDNPEQSKSAVLTKTAHYQRIKFNYTSLGEGVGVPRTGDNGEVLWAIAACVSSLAIVFAFSAKKRRHTDK